MSNWCVFEEGEEDDGSIQSQFHGKEKEEVHIVQCIVEGAILFSTNVATCLSGIIVEPIINISHIFEIKIEININIGINTTFPSDLNNINNHRIIINFTMTKKRL
ncbi:hypothetical protein ACTA71_005885 [Dictyostelium dimigraforme]